MALHLSQVILNDMQEVEKKCSTYIFIVNGIYSWGQELKQSQKTSEEGSFSSLVAKFGLTVPGSTLPQPKSVYGPWLGNGS